MKETILYSHANDETRAVFIIIILLIIIIILIINTLLFCWLRYLKDENAQIVN